MRATRISQAIADHLAFLGCSQADLARSAGVRQDSLSRYANGLATPRTANRRRLAKAMGLDEKQLIEPFGKSAGPAQESGPHPAAGSNTIRLRLDAELTLAEAQTLIALIQKDARFARVVVDQS